MSRDDAIDKLIHNLKHHNFIDDEEMLKEAVLKRESESTTAIGMNVAIRMLNQMLSNSLS